MYNIQSEHNYVMLPSVIQLVNYMFRPIYLAIIRLYLAYRGLLNSINRMVPIFAIYMLCTMF